MSPRPVGDSKFDILSFKSFLRAIPSPFLFFHGPQSIKQLRPRLGLLQDGLDPRPHLVHHADILPQRVEPPVKSLRQRPHKIPQVFLLHIARSLGSFH